MTASDLVVAQRLALDLGTARTRLASADGRLRLEAPSAVERLVRARRSLAVERRLQWPVVHGVVVNVEAVARLLAPRIRELRGAIPFKPRILVCHPSDASQEERDRLVAAVLQAGAGAVRLAPEPLAALLGADAGGGPWPRVVVDFGEGVTDIALVQPGRLLSSAAVRRGLAEIRQGVRQTVAEEQGISLKPEEIIDLLNRQADSPTWQAVERPPSRRRRDRQGGRRELRHLMLVRSTLITRIIDSALDAIERSASALIASLDRRERAHAAADGVLLAGGGGLIPDLGAGLARRLGLPVRVAADPLSAVIDGARWLLRADPGGDWLMAFPASLSVAGGS